MLGSDDPQTLRAKGNLAVNLRMLSDFPGAYEIDTAAVAGWQQTVSENDVRLLFAQAKQMVGVVLLQHPERAADLMAVLGERRNFRALRRVAEEHVEHLFHPAKVSLDLPADLLEQHPLLRTAEDVVDQRRRPRGDRARLA